MRKIVQILHTRVQRMIYELALIKNEKSAVFFRKYLTNSLQLKNRISNVVV